MIIHLESMNNIYNVGLYIRLSREDDDKNYESESITNQKSLLLQYAKENNLRVYDIYIDDGFSGTNFDRPGFIRLIKDIEKKNQYGYYKRYVSTWKRLYRYSRTR